MQHGRSVSTDGTVHPPYSGVLQQLSGEATPVCIDWKTVEPIYENIEVNGVYHSCYHSGEPRRYPNPVDLPIGESCMGSFLIKFISSTDQIISGTSSAILALRDQLYDEEDLDDTAAEDNVRDEEGEPADYEYPEDSEDTDDADFIDDDSCLDDSMNEEGSDTC